MCLCVLCVMASVTFIYKRRRTLFIFKIAPCSMTPFFFFFFFRLLLGTHDSPSPRADQVIETRTFFPSVCLPTLRRPSSSFSFLYFRRRGVFSSIYIKIRGPPFFFFFFRTSDAAAQCLPDLKPQITKTAQTNQQNWRPHV